MKTLAFLFALALILLALVGASASYTRRENAKTRAHAEQMAAELRAAPTTLPLPAASAPSPQRKVTWVPGLNRYVEHDASVSARTAVGLNAASKERIPEPVAQGDLRKQQFGWPQSGTALDRAAKR